MEIIREHSESSVVVQRTRTRRKLKRQDAFDLSDSTMSLDNVDDRGETPKRVVSFSGSYLSTGSKCSSPFVGINS